MSKSRASARSSFETRAGRLNRAEIRQQQEFEEILAVLDDALADEDDAVGADAFWGGGYREQRHDRHDWDEDQEED